MLNKWVIALTLGFLVAGCAGKNILGASNTLAAAQKQQEIETEKAFVFATFETVNGPSGLSQGLGAFLIGTKPADSFIAFGGSPLKQDWQNIPAKAKLQMYSDNKQKPLAFGMFTFSPNRNWALVYPNRYALLQFLGSDNVFADFRGWGRQDQKAYLVFNVNPGEAVYLGHIKVQIQNGQNVVFAVEDRFEEFKRALPQSLEAKLQKRIVAAPNTIYAESIETKPRENLKTYTIYK